MPAARRIGRSCTRIIAAGLIATASATAFAGSGELIGYEAPVLIARSSLDSGSPSYRLPPFTSLSSQPTSIDEFGSVAIRAFVGSSGITEGVFVGSPTAGGLVITANSSEPVYTSGVSLKGGRLAVADADFDGGATLYDGVGNQLARFNPGGSLGVTGLTSLSSLGDLGPTTFGMAYRADFGFAGDRIAIDIIETSSGSPVRTQTEVANSFDGTYNFLFSPSANGSMQVAFQAWDDADQRTLNVYEPGAGVTELRDARPGSIYNSFVNSVDIDGEGGIAFSGRLTAGNLWQVVRMDPDDNYAADTVIAQGGDMGIDNGSLVNFPPASAACGLVAFRATDITEAGESTALFVGDGETLVRVVGLGDTAMTDLGPIPFGFDFGGTTGIQTMNSNIDINDDGVVGFAAFLANGTIGVFTAQPIFAEQGCNDADIAAPFGTLNFADVQAFLGAFGSGDASADLAAPMGVFNFADVQAFLGAFGQGCP